MKKKIRVGVLRGGPSAEREISLITGQAVFDNLDRKKYLPTLIDMDKDSRFFAVGKNGQKKLLDLQNKDRKLFDIIFIALHGTPGEDGTVQGMLEFLGIPYTGPNTLSSAVAMNKVFTAQVYRENGLNTPEFIHIKKNGWIKYKNKALKDIKKGIGFPCVVKPVDQGSAVGVDIVKKETDLSKVIDQTFKEFGWVMVQKFIKGAEATCGVLEKNGERFALPPTHILPVLGEFYDYKAKYAKGGSRHVCPADFPPAINKILRELALRAHTALRCQGMSRTDFIIPEKVLASGKVRVEEMKVNGGMTAAPYFTPDIYILETNTIPGMTPTSLLPEAAGNAGINFPRMLDMIIEASL